MRLISQNHTQLLISGLLGGVVLCCNFISAQNNQNQQDLILKFKTENRKLKQALVASNKSEQEATHQLNQVRQRLEALGKNLLDGGDDRLIQAASDLEIANERVHLLEAASANLSSCIQSFLLKTVSPDPESRLFIESAKRELDSLIGLRQKPRPDVRAGDLQRAQIVSLDQESGLIVLNLGENQGAKIGMTFHLLHGQQPYGKVILADVRKGISGAFVEHIDGKDNLPKLGDIALLLTQN